MSQYTIILVFVLLSLGCSFDSADSRTSDFSKDWQVVQYEDSELSGLSDLTWIDVNSNWYNSASSIDQKTNLRVLYKKNFRVNSNHSNYCYLKIGELDASTTVWCNDKKAVLNPLGNNDYVVDLSEHLYMGDKENSIMVKTIKRNLNHPVETIKLVELPDLHIPVNGVTSYVKEKGKRKFLALKVKVKNASIKEQQCILRIVFENGSKQSINETPLFLEAKTENTYEQCFTLSEESNPDDVIITSAIIRSGNIIDKHIAMLSQN